MSRLLGTSLLATLLLLGNARIAAADVLPPDACFDEGKSCVPVPASGGAMGVCKMSKCQRPAPPGEAGAGIIVYDCLRCLPGSPGGTGGVPSTGGAGDSGGVPSSGGADESGGTPSSGGAGGVLSGGAAGQIGQAGNGGGSPSSSSGCDCGFRRYRSDYSLALLMAITGLLLMRSSRRRR